MCAVAFSRLSQNLLCCFHYSVLPASMGCVFSDVPLLKTWLTCPLCVSTFFSWWGWVTPSGDIWPNLWTFRRLRLSFWKVKHLWRRCGKKSVRQPMRRSYITCLPWVSLMGGPATPWVGGCSWAGVIVRSTSPPRLIHSHPTPSGCYFLCSVTCSIFHQKIFSVVNS